MYFSKAKLLLIALAVLCAAGAHAQLPFPIPQGSPGVNPQVYYSQFKRGLGLPVVHDTAAALAVLPDSLGWIIQVRTNGYLYRRDTVPAGGHYWNQIGNGSSGGAWGSITGLLTSQVDLYDSIQARQRQLGFVPIAPGDTATMLAAYLRLATAQASFYPLAANPAGYLTNNGLPNVLNFPQVINLGGTTGIAIGIYVGRPTAGIAGRIYIATDSAAIYEDNGSTWLKIGNGGGSGGGGTIAWGALTGTLSSQTDLQNALNLNLKIAQNLADLNNATTARANLGIPLVQNVDQTNANNLTSGTVNIARLDTTSSTGITTRALAQKKADSLGILISNRQKDLKMIPITWYGAVGDSSTDCTTAIQAAIVAAGTRGAVYMPAGIYKITAALHIPPGAQISLIGAGGSVGAIENSITKIVYSFTTGDALVDSADNTTIKGFDLQNNASSPTAGSGIHMVGRFAYISDMSIIGNWNNMVLDNSYYDRLSNVSFVDAVNYDLLNQNTANPDFGDLTVDGCYFLSGYGNNLHATTAGIFQPNSGGMKITNCKWNSGSTKIGTGILGVFSGSGNATGDLFISNNSFENYRTAAIDLAVPSSNFSNITITGGNIESNNSATGIRLRGATGGLHRITITGVSISAVDSAIAAYNVDHLSIAGNDIDSPSTVTVGVTLSSCTNTWYDRNMVVNYSGVLFMGSGTYANKPAASGGPGLYYATDSARMMFATGSSWIFITDKANQVFHLYMRRKGQPGDSTMVTGTDSTIWVAALRDSLGFHHVFNADGSITMWSTGGGSGDTTNLSHRIDTVSADVEDVEDSVIGILAKTDKHLYFNNDQTVSGVDTLGYGIGDTSFNLKGLLVKSTDGTVVIVHSASNQHAVIYDLSASASIATAVGTRVLNQSGASFLGAGTYAGKPAASTGTGLWWASDSLAFWYSNGSIWTKASNNVGGPGVIITSPNATITVGGIPSAPTLDLNLAHANIWQTTQTSTEWDLSPRGSSSSTMVYPYYSPAGAASLMVHPGGSTAAGAFMAISPRATPSGVKASLTILNSDYSADSVNWDGLQISAQGYYSIYGIAQGSHTNQPFFLGYNGIPVISMWPSQMVGINNFSPQYPIDMYKVGSTPNLFHISGSGTADDGAYLMSLASNYAALSAGGNYNGSAWVAKSTAPTLLVLSNGLNVYANSGTSINSTFSPQAVWSVDNAGQAHMPLYNSTNMIGTVTYGLGTNSSGDVYKYAIPVVPASPVLYSCTGSVSLTNSTTQTSILSGGVGTPSVAGNVFVAGNHLIIHGYAVVSNSSGSSVNLGITPYYNSTSMGTANFTIPNDASNHGIEITADISVPSLGTSVSGLGVVKLQMDGQVTHYVSVSATWNTTINNNIDIRAQWGTAASTISLTSNPPFTVEIR